MKKILFLLAMLPMMVFTACSSNEEDGLTLKAEQIEGHWAKYENSEWNRYRHYSFTTRGTWLGFAKGGDYKIVGNRIEMSNDYGTDIILEVKSINSSEMTVIETEGYEKTNLTLRKYDPLNTPWGDE